MSKPYMENDNGVWGTDGKFHEVKPALMKLSDKISVLSSKLRSDTAYYNIVAVKMALDPILGSPMPILDENGYTIPDPEPGIAQMEILKLATGETEEQINEWCDFIVADEVKEIFYGISNLKKKQTEK